MEKRILSKTPPHKHWIDDMARNCGIYGNKELCDRLAQLPYSDAVLALGKELRKNELLDVDTIAGAFSVWYPLTTATEFIVDLDNQYIKLANFVHGTIKEVADKSIVKRFRYPFEDIVITFSYKKKYLPIFISVYKMVEKYRNKSGKFEDTYLIKMCGLKGGVNTTDAPVLFEFQYIESLFSRINITCVNFPNCPNRVERTIIGYLPNGGISTSSNETCFKSWNTCGSCPQHNNTVFPVIPENVPFAQQCYYVFNIVCYVLEKFNNRQTIEVTHEIKKRNTRGGVITTGNRGYSNRILSLTTRPKYSSKNTGEKRGSHKSPVEHVRREHLRRLPNGKVIKVKQSVVNRGSLNKPTYKIDS